MKILTSFLLLSALLMVHCKDNSKGVTQSTAAALKDAPVNVNCAVENFANDAALSQTDVSIEQGGHVIGHETTNAEGRCVLSDVRSDKQYTFNKSGYQVQRLMLDSFLLINGINVFLKPNSSQPTGPMNLQGYVFKIVAGQPNDTIPWTGLTVVSGTATINTDKDGFYNLPVGTAQSYVLEFRSQSQAMAQLTVKPQQDTSRLDLYLNAMDSLIIDHR